MRSHAEAAEAQGCYWRGDATRYTCEVRDPNGKLSCRDTATRRDANGVAMCDDCVCADLVAFGYKLADYEDIADAGEPVMTRAQIERAVAREIERQAEQDERELVHA